MIIFDYILENKEWIFSGIGVSLFLGIISLLFSKYVKHSQNLEANRKINSANINGSGNSVSQSINNYNIFEPSSFSDRVFEEYPEHPSALDILNQYNALTPFQQIDNDEVIAGVKIKAEVEFYSITRAKTVEGQKYLAFFNIKCPESMRNGFSIYSAIDIDEFPMFRSLPKNQDCLIAGIIISVKHHQIIIDLKLIKVITPRKTNQT